jgi:hypothetical protein
MLRQITRGSLVLLALAIWVDAGKADVFVRVPFVGVYVGQPGTFVRVPFVRVDVPNAVPVVPTQVQVPPPPLPVNPGTPVVPPMPPASPEPVVVQPPPQPVPPAPGAAVAARAPTLNEFAASFKPAPGAYSVVLLNPITNNPVNVTFTLPPGNPRVRVFPRRLEFDYGTRRESVEIRFDRKDRVHVQSR